MNKKYIIIGGVAGGASVAARLRRLDEKAEIIVFDKGKDVSFSNCALPYRLSNMIDDSERLVLMNPTKFKKSYNIDVFSNHEVIKVDTLNKLVKVKDLINNKVFEERYDKLILSPGAKAINPPIKGIEDASVFNIKNVTDIRNLLSYIEKNNAKNITVIGGGFIGIETAENLKKGGYNVTLIEALPQILKIFDYDIVQLLHKELMDKGINLILNEKVDSFDHNDCITDKNRRIKGDLIIMAIGVKPDTDMLIDSNIVLEKGGYIKVDHNYMTSNKDVYAIGDSVKEYNPLLETTQSYQMAGPALKAARDVADHIYNKDIKNKGYIGSSCIKVFDYNAARTGLTEEQLLNLNVNYDKIFIIPNERVGLIPNTFPIFLKVLFSKEDAKILGAQAISKGDSVKRIDVIASIMKFSGTLYDLKDVECCYAPPYATARDPLNYAGYVGLNILNKIYSQYDFTKLRDLVESNAYILDVREENEYENGHIIGSINIPLSTLRNRLDELPRDKDIYLHCRSSQRSYNALMCLKGNGFERLYNITGSYIMFSHYEYVLDTLYKRESILTKYNFK